ncbi:DUF305 domain-containing protein [Antribacter gilvus]|uniref:DUF305 domain-containing protein n=1 Tax=Antribacter gilvus TaxID=2304675 RepID=UPI000F77CCC5|nr:DUF305 domain-containing protein [Antribacter gilvus]
MTTLPRPDEPLTEPDLDAESERPASGSDEAPVPLWRRRLKAVLIVLAIGVALNAGLYLWLGVSVPARQEAAGYSESDAIYADVMLVHHAQAVELASLAQGRTEDPEILAMADEITEVSSTRIEELGTWLRDRGIPVPDAASSALALAAEEAPEEGSGPRTVVGGHEHGADAPPHGMLSPEQVEVVAGLEGTLFELHLLDGLIRHHDGAVTLAGDEIYAGEDDELVALAEAEKAETEAQLERLRELLGPKMFAKSD